MTGLIQRSFSGGEIAPALGARADTAKYQTALRLLRNFFVMRHGGVANRPGTKLICEVKDSSKATRLIPFVFNDSQAYELEFGDLYVRIILNSVRVTISAPSAFSGVAAYAAGDLVSSAGTNYYSKTTHAASATVPASDTDNWYALTGTIFEMPSPYTAAELFDIKPTQSADVLSLFHGSHPPHVLSRLGATAWTLEPEAFLPSIDGPTSLSASTGGGTGFDIRYKVTALKFETYEESLPGSAASPPTVDLYGGSSLAGYATYSPATTYALGARVKVGSVAYVSLQAVNIANTPPTPPATSVFWYAVSPAGADIIITEAGHGLSTGAVVLMESNPSSPLNSVWMAAIDGKLFAVTVLNANALTLDNTDAALIPGTQTAWMAFDYVKLTNVGQPSSTNDHALAWTASAEAVEYWIYRSIVKTGSTDQGVFGYIGKSASTTFIDDGTEWPANQEETPPQFRNPFQATGDFPSTGGYFQQRAVFANSDNDPRTVWLSRSGNFKNLTIRSPLQDDDAVTFEVAGQRVNEVRHVLDLGQLVVLTAGTQHAAQGDTDGVIRPDAINLRSQGNSGASTVAPVLVDDSAIFVQARNSVFRDFRYDVTVGAYAGKDLTVYAPHLVDGHTIIELAYAEARHSIIWAVRDDGVLLGLTYIRDQDIWGWHHHDTGTTGCPGYFESVSSIPEGDEDAVYVIVKRIVNGSTKRFIERFTDRKAGFDDYSLLDDAWFVDSGVEYNGYHLGLDAVTYVAAAGTMTLTTATTYVAGQTLTLQASLASFQGGSGDNGMKVRLVSGSDSIDVTVANFGDSDTLTCTSLTDVPTSLRATATVTWYLLTSTISGLSHLNTETVALFVDGRSATPAAVSGGSVTVAGAPAGIARVGLQIVSDLQTLDADAPVKGETFSTKQKRVTGCFLHVEDSAGTVSVGPDDDGLLDVPLDPEGVLTDLVDGKIPAKIETVVGNSGSVFIRMDTPLPLMLLAITPNVTVGGNG